MTVHVILKIGQRLLCQREKIRSLFSMLKHSLYTTGNGNLVNVDAVVNEAGDTITFTVVEDGETKTFDCDFAEGDGYVMINNDKFIKQ